MTDIQQNGLNPSNSGANVATEDKNIPDDVRGIIESNQKYIDRLNEMCKKYSRKIENAGGDSELEAAAKNLGRVLVFTAQITEDTQNEYYKLQREKIIEEEIKERKNDPEETRTEDEIRESIERDEEFIDGLNSRIKDGLNELVGAVANGVIESGGIFNKIMDDKSTTKSQVSELEEFLEETDEKSANSVENQLEGEKNIAFIRDFVIETKKEQEGNPLAVSEDDIKELERTHGEDANKPELIMKKYDGIPPQTALIPASGLAPLIVSLIPGGQLIYLALLIAEIKILPKFTRQYRKAVSTKKDPPIEVDKPIGNKPLESNQPISIKPTLSEIKVGEAEIKKDGDSALKQSHTDRLAAGREQVQSKKNNAGNTLLNL